MASRSRLTITVTKSTSQSTVAISSNGKYASLVTNSIGYRETGQPLFSTASEQAFWAAVLPIVQAAIAAGHLRAELVGLDVELPGSRSAVELEAGQEVSTDA